MISGSFFNALKGIGNEFEALRILGSFGTSVFIVAPVAFVATGVIKNVSLTEFSLAYPAGLAACLTALAKAIQWKDKGVAEAKATEASTSATNANTADQVAATEASKPGG